MTSNKEGNHINVSITPLFLEKVETFSKKNSLELYSHKQIYSTAVYYYLFFLLREGKPFPNDKQHAVYGDEKVVSRRINLTPTVIEIIKKNDMKPTLLIKEALTYFFERYEHETFVDILVPLNIELSILLHPSKK